LYISYFVDILKRTFLFFVSIFEHEGAKYLASCNVNSAILKVELLARLLTTRRPFDN